MNQLQERSWWSRNWKWFVPVSCLGGIVLFVGFCAVVAYIIFGTAEQLVSVEFLNSESEIRISRYSNPGCAGHLADIYVLDIIKNHNVIKTIELDHYFGPI
ncbi:MAG: hypothetical protein PVI06_10170 [Desulfobacterales bacterium]